VSLVDGDVDHRMASRRRHALLAAALRDLERCRRGGDHLFDGAGFGGDAIDPDAHRQSAFAQFGWQGRHRQLLQKALADEGRLGRSRGRQKDDEFVAADTAGTVLRAKRRSQRIGDDDERRVAHRIAQGVVDPLEVVAVDEHRRQRGARAIHAGQLVDEDFLQAAPVEQPRQRILRCLVNELLIGGEKLIDQVGDALVREQPLGHVA
jgi:hypothetical protein